MKNTLLLGASLNPHRTSYTAVERLSSAGHPVFPIGRAEGKINGTNILTGRPELKDIDTVSLYLNPKHQVEYYGYVLDLKPRRIIFNPGTENPEFIQMARKEGIETEIGCMLVMLSLGIY